MTKIKSYLTSIIEFFLSLRAIISFTLLTLVFKIQIAFGSNPFDIMGFISDIFLSTLFTYFNMNGLWSAPTPIFDTQYELEQESRTLWYRRFLLFYDNIIFLMVGRSMIKFALDYHLFNRTDAIILISILSILAIGKFLLNRPEESNNTTSHTKK